MSFFGLSQRSPDCNGDVIAWAEVPEIISASVPDGQLWIIPQRRMYETDAEFKARCVSIVNVCDPNDRDCWWEGGMAG